MSARRGTPRPPRFTSALLRTFLGHDGEFVLGDMEEEYREVHAARGEAGANRWYRRQAASTAWAWMRRGSGGTEQWLRDVRNGAKALLRAPGFSLATVVTLGLGLGGVASVVALAESVLRPLRFPDAERLVAVWESHDGERRGVAPANYLDWRSMSTSFDALAAHRTTSMSIRVDGLARRGRVADVSGNFFDVIGIAPRFGRTFDLTLRTDFPERVAVLSHSAWVSSFAGDPGVLGRAFRIDDLTYEVIGVAPPGLDFPEAGLTAWVRSPTEAPEIRGFGSKLPQLRDAWYFEVVGRLSDGVTLSTARDEMDAVSLRLAGLHPDTNTGAGTLLIPLLEQTVAGFRSTLMALTIAVALLLLAAGVNVTHLALGRGDSRRSDTAIRVALGAGRSALVRQVLAEGWLLGLGGRSRAGHRNARDWRAGARRFPSPCRRGRLASAHRARRARTRAHDRDGGVAHRIHADPSVGAPVPLDGRPRLGRPGSRQWSGGRPGRSSGRPPGRFWTPGAERATAR